MYELVLWEGTIFCGPNVEIRFDRSWPCEMKDKELIV